MSHVFPPATGCAPCGAEHFRFAPILVITLVGLLAAVGVSVASWHSSRHVCGKAKAFKETTGHASLEFAALRIDSPCPRRCQGYASCSSCQVLSVQICFECMKAVHEGNANVACAVAQVCFIYAFAHALLKSRLSLLSGRMFNLSLQSAPIEVWCCELPSLR